jgi:hypothetical protein
MMGTVNALASRCGLVNTGGANWEHKAVKPDIEVKGDQDAGQLAVELARQHK